MTLNVFIAVWLSHFADLAGRSYSINYSAVINISELRSAYPGDRAVQCVRLRSFVSWNYGSESRRDHVSLSLVNVLCCQISAKGQSLVQRSLH